MDSLGNHHLSRLNQRGNTLLTVLMLTAGVSIGFYFLSDQVIMQKQQIEKNASTLQLRLGLHSVVDYVLFGIKQRWCFNPTLLPESACDLSHPASVERLLMSEAQENFIRAAAATNPSMSVPSGPLRLQGFKKAIPVGDLTSKHPLFTILSRIRSPEMKYVVVSVEKDSSSALPTSGREVYLQIKVALATDEAGTPLMYGTYPLTASSFTSVHPRELGSFAMIVAGNLRLDKAFNEALPRGDVAFHKFSNKASLGSSTGLIFESPVFVNRDVHMPFASSMDRKDSNLAYSPVTFAERVYMGDGRVFEGGAPYAPSTSGAPGDQYWTDNKLFGGFLRGLENDGARDGGLDYVGMLESGTAVDTSLALKCAIYNLSKADLNFIAKADLQVERLSTTAQKSNYRMGLAHDIEFIPQSNDAYRVDASDWRGFQSRVLEDPTNKKPIMALEVQMGDQRVIAQMTRDSKLTLKPLFFDIDAAINSKNNELNRLPSNPSARELDDARNVIRDNPAKITAKERTLKNKEDELDAEEDKRPRNNSKIRDLKDDIRDLKSEIDTLKRQMIAAQSLIDAVPTRDRITNELNDLRDQKNNPPELIIDVDLVQFNGHPQPHLAGLSFEYKNMKNFRNQSRNMVAPVIYARTYDASFNKSSPVKQSNENMKLRGYFNFTISGSNLISPDGISRTPVSGQNISTPTSTTDVFELAEKCDTQTLENSGSSFGAASWDYSFTTRARHSWNFTQDPAHPNQGFVDPQISRYTFDGTNSVPGATLFQVRSIVGECVVKPNATFITGFYTCDHLIIEPRALPLRIIATIIVSKATIDPTAFQAGIRWSSIYSPQATPELRAAMVLKSVSGAPCNSGNSPIWHPVPSIVETADRYACYPVSLRLKADPFTWTTVDPDCGLLPGAPTTSCKKRLVRYFVVEQSRESGL